jgi:hypothetical protein
MTNKRLTAPPTPPGSAKVTVTIPTPPTKHKGRTSAAVPTHGVFEHHATASAEHQRRLLD